MTDDPAPLPTQSARIAAVDLNGQLRGKRIPATKSDSPMQLPLSALNVDLFGADIEGSPLVFQSGDADGVLVPTDRGPIPLPWVPGTPSLTLATVSRPDGTPFSGDPRHALMRVLDRYAARGWHPVCAVELEFFLVETDGALAAPLNPTTRRRVKHPEILSLREIDQFAAFFDDVEQSAREMGLPDQVVTSEAALGQFEITLAHVAALRAADDTLLMRELIKGTALRHGMTATFLPKPFANESGTGLHMHASIVDADGANVLRDHPDLLQQAVAGCLDTMQAATAIFAPYAPSYARFVDNAHAPTAATWGYDNRTVALRIPAGPPAATRIEHRVAGGDVNPYLLFAAVLGGMLSGIEDARSAPPATSGNAYEADAPAGLAHDLDSAIQALTSPDLARIFPPLLIDNLRRTKAQELAKMAAIPNSELTAMLVDLL